MPAPGPHVAEGMGGLGFDFLARGVRPVSAAVSARALTGSEPARADETGARMERGSVIRPGAELPWALPARGVRARLLVTAWTAAVAALFLLRLDEAPLFDVDEGAFAQATRELVQSGDLWSTTLNGAPRYDKPILVYWLQAASLAAFGPGEAAVRLPSALCALLWSLVIVRFAWRRLGLERALLAGTIMASSVGVVIIGRAATADALLNLLLALATLDGWEHLATGRRAPLLRAYAWIGLGLLAKGPVAVLVPAAAALAYCLSRRDGRGLLRLVSDPLGWALLLGVAGPWYAYALHRHGWEFFQGFVLKHNVYRYLTRFEGHGGSPAYYLLLLPVMLLPWSALLPSLAVRIRALWAGPLERYLLCWAGFVLAFFSLSATKLPHYALYGATPLFLLLATTAFEAGRVSRALTLGTVWLVLTICAFLPWLAPVVGPHVRDALVRDLLSAPSGRAGLAASASALVAAAAWSLSRIRIRSFVPQAALGALLASAVLAGWSSPWLAEVLQGPVKRLGQLASLRREEAVQWNVDVPSFAFYRGQATPRRPPAPGELAIVRLDRFAAAQHADVDVLRRERGYALVRRRVSPVADDP